MPNVFGRVKHAGYFQKLNSYGISGQVFGLISFFLVSIIDGFKWFWMETLDEKAPFLVVHVSYYALMIFLMMLYVILPTILMILLSVLLSALCVIRPLICGNS